MHEIDRDSQSETGRASSRYRSGTFLALSCVGLMTSPALAQQASGEAGTTRLGGVTVTDTAIDDSYNRTEAASVKFTQPLLDTPRSVTVIPSEVIRDRGFTTLTEVLRSTPGITLGAGEGGTPLGDRPFIRGYEASTDMQVNGIRNVVLDYWPRAGKAVGWILTLVGIVAVGYGSLALKAFLTQ